MEAQDRVRLEMVNVGSYQNRVLQVLSKVKGLSQAPEVLVSSTPCIIADDIPKEIAEKLQGFLEKAGAAMRVISMNEPEEDLFSPDDLPMADDFSAAAQSADDVPEFTPDDWALGASTQGENQSDEDDAGGPSDEFGGFSAVETSSIADENTEDELFGENAAMEDKDMMADFEPQEPEKKPKKTMSFPSFPKFGKKDNTPRTTEDDENAAVKEKKKPALSSLFKKKPRPEIEESEETVPDETNGASKKPAANSMLMLIVGLLIGAVLFGTGGWWIGKSSTPGMSPVDETALQNAQSQNAQLQAAVDQRTQEIQALTEQKNALQQELDAVKAQAANPPAPTSIEPSQTPEIGQTPDQAALIASFKALSNQHALALENSYEAQKQAACSKQMLLDGSGEIAYAQIVRKFSAKFTSFDILQNNSLLTPYIAELKMPFQMEIRTGKTEQTCQAAQLKSADTSSHPEFGTFYGVWTIQYVYRDGKWSVKSAVIEKNRALIAKAYKVGSPDSAKLPLDFSLYPGLKN